MFFKKKEGNENNFLIKICALLIHAAKIDEDYTAKEEEIIKKTLEELSLDKKKNIRNNWTSKKFRGKFKSNFRFYKRNKKFIWKRKNKNNWNFMDYNLFK